MPHPFIRTCPGLAALLLAVSVAVLPGRAAAQALPSEDTSFTVRSADNDPDLIVVREGYDAATRTQSLYLRTFDGTADRQVFSGRLTVRGAEVLRVITSGAELVNTDARWGVRGMNYGGDPRNRGLDGADPESHVPVAGDGDDAIRVEDAQTVRFWMATGADVDDLRILIRYPSEPGPASFDVNLFWAQRADPMGWLTTTQGGIQVGSLVDSVPDDGDYSEVFEVRNIKLRIEDLDVEEDYVTVGEVPPEGGTAGPATVTVDNFAAGTDYDQDNGFDQNGLISPIPAGSDLEHLTFWPGPLTHYQGLAVLPPEVVHLLNPPGRIVVGQSIPVSVTVDVPPGMPSGAYSGRMEVYEDNNEDGFRNGTESFDLVSLTVFVGAIPDAAFDLGALPDFALPDMHVIIDAAPPPDALVATDSAVTADGAPPTDASRRDAILTDGGPKPSDGSPSMDARATDGTIGTDGHATDGGRDVPSTAMDGRVTGDGTVDGAVDGAIHADAVTAQDGRVVDLGPAPDVGTDATPGHGRVDYGTPRGGAFNCAAAGHPVPRPWVPLASLLVATAAFGTRRRKVRIQAPLVVLGLLVLPTAARAVDALYLRRFGPTPVLSPYLSMDGTHTLGDGGAGLSALGSFERRPAIFEKKGERTIDIISDRYATDLALTYGFLPRVDFGIDVPIIVSQAGRGPEGAGLTSFAVGDPALGLKFELVDKMKNPIGLALIGTASLPLGNKEALAGEENSTMGGRLALEIPQGNHSDLAFNAGYRARQITRVEELILNDELTAGLGLTTRLHNRVQVMAELNAATPAGSPFSSVSATPVDGNGALRIRLWDGLQLVLGGGAGLVPGYGAPAWRAFAGFEAAPRRHDWDADQVADGDDDCVDMPGLISEHGCPGKAAIAAKPVPTSRPAIKPMDDADGDFVKDEVDQCPFLAEDLDRFQDGDGCPDPDNDLDMIADAYDGDPMGPEDWDGFEDDDGIEDPDNDRDGVADLEDKCPNEAAETENGCPGGKRAVAQSGGGGHGTASGPDPGADGPLLLGDTLHPAQPIVFEFAEPTLTPSGETQVEGLAEFIKAHPEQGKIEVGVHVDSLGNRRWKVWLSQARAESVVSALKAHGVSAERLVARGYGFDVPVADDGTPQGRLLNRRVELRLMDKSAANETLPPVMTGQVSSPEGQRGPVVRPDAPIKFVPKTASLAPESWEAVQSLVKALKAHPEWKRVEVDVHTDGRGDRARKFHLSQERAETVRRALVAAGIEERRLQARGFGALVPVATDDTAEGRAQNRRVELTVLGGPAKAAPAEHAPSEEGHSPLSQREPGNGSPEKTE